MKLVIVALNTNPQLIPPSTEIRFKSDGQFIPNSTGQQLNLEKAQIPFTV